jgi:hypothetical protein
MLTMVTRSCLLEIHKTNGSKCVLISFRKVMEWYCHQENIETWEKQTTSELFHRRSLQTNLKNLMPVSPMLVSPRYQHSV